MFSSIGDFDQGIVNGEKSAELFRQNGLFSRAAIPLNNIGFWLAGIGQLKLAEQCLLEALELQKKERQFSREAAICDSLGYAYTLTGRHNDAESMLTASVKIFERLDNNAELAPSLLHLSELYQQTRQYQLGREVAARALKLGTEANLDTLCTEANNLLLTLESDIHRYPENGSTKVRRLCSLINDNLHGKLSLKPRETRAED